MTDGIEQELYGTGLLGDALTGQRAKLFEEFLVPPFSVLDARAGAWQTRKKLWRERYGLVGEVGRGENLMRYGGGANLGALDTSIFDPVLTEIMVRWYSTENDVVFDPFAGGVTRGGVSGMLGRRYFGIDLRPEQIAANRQWAETYQPPVMPKWAVGDSARVALPPVRADFVLTCPPYGSLERYSDNPADLSALDWPEFVAAYTIILRRTADILNDNRFAVVVVSNFREGPNYRNLVAATVAGFAAAGVDLYGDFVVARAIGTASLRARRIFRKRKPTPNHDSVLLFCKGDPDKAAERLGDNNGQFSE